MTTKPFYWSVRREVWENRAVLVVPACAALLFLVAFALNLPGLPATLSDGAPLDPDLQAVRLIRPYRMVCFLLTLASLLTGLFYSLDALHGERRDRSILFWKSLPVSDRVTVLSKAFIPLILLPVVTLAACLATQLVMLLLSAGTLLAAGDSLAPLRALPLFPLWGEVIGGVAVLAVWQAPIHGWLLLVSGWARRAVLLWAVLVPLAICLFERFAFGSDYLASLLVNRLTAGILGEGLLKGHWLGLSPLERLMQLTPAHLAADLNLWIGLIPTTLLLAGAIAARRYRQPL
jgi:ABC-2 type transport system permease protein